MDLSIRQAYLDNFPISNIENNLKDILNTKFSFYGIKKIIFLDFEIEEPFIRVAEDLFGFSDEAKSKLNNLSTNDFFDAYDIDNNLFVTKKFDIRLVKPHSDELRVYRLYFYAKGRLTYSVRTPHIVGCGRLIHLSEISFGKSTKAAR